MALPPPRLTKLQARPRVSRAKQHRRRRRAERDQRTDRRPGRPRPAKGRDRAVRRPRAARPPLRPDGATAGGRGVAPASIGAFWQAPSTRAPLRDAPCRRVQPSTAAAGVGLSAFSTAAPISRHLHRRLLGPLKRGFAMLHHSTCTTKNLITKLIKNYEERSIHAALLQHWAKINEIPFSKFKQTNAAARFLTASHLSEVESIRRILSQSIFKLSIKDIERIFEVLIDSGRRKSQGAFYTPDFIIEYLVRHGLQLGNHRRTEAPLICDPACGSGGFLIRAAEILKDDISPDRAFAECLVGFDNDPWAIEHARCLIELFLILHGFELSGIDLRLFCRDILLCSHENLWNLSGAYNGFNLVTTNPPYVKLQTLHTSSCKTSTLNTGRD